MEQNYFKLKNLRAIEVKFLCATNTLGARIVLKEEDFNGRAWHKTFNYDYECNNIGEQAFKILTRNGIKVVCKATRGNTDLFLIDSWAKEYKGLKSLH